MYGKLPWPVCLCLFSFQVPFNSTSYNVVIRYNLPGHHRSSVRQCPYPKRLELGTSLRAANMDLKKRSIYEGFSLHYYAFVIASCRSVERSKKDIERNLKRSVKSLCQWLWWWESSFCAGDHSTSCLSSTAHVKAASLPLP